MTKAFAPADSDSRRVFLRQTKKSFSTQESKQKIKKFQSLSAAREVINKEKKFPSLARRAHLNSLFSSSFSSAELAALEISGGVPKRPDDVLKSESPELQPWGIGGTRKYL
jgi:hypothetical protein